MNFAWIIATTCTFSLITIARAGNFTEVSVGKNGNLAFDPPFVSDFVGEILVEPALGIWSGGIIFQSYKANPPHNISESTFEQPCVPKPGGILLWGVPKDRPFAEMIVQIGGEPRWFHVSTASRCASGMVFAINPTYPQTYEAFKAKAIGRNESSSSSPSASSPNSTSPSVNTTSSTSIQKIAATLAGVTFLVQLLL